MHVEMSAQRRLLRVTSGGRHCQHTIGELRFIIRQKQYLSCQLVPAQMETDLDRGGKRERRPHIGEDVPPISPHPHPQAASANS